MTNRVDLVKSGQSEATDHARLSELIAGLDNLGTRFDDWGAGIETSQQTVRGKVRMDTKQ